MARIRTIKPEFWTSEQVMECSMNARLLFIGLWNFCDDKGRHAYSPRTIKAEVLPGDNFTADEIDGLLQELSLNGLVSIYAVGDKKFLQVTGWHHQRIDKPQKAKHPSPIEDHSENGQGTFDAGREGSRQEGKGKIPPSEGASAPPASPDKALFDYGKQVLGASAGGLIKRLKEHAGIDGAMAHLREAEGKSTPREWIGGILVDPEARADRDHEAWQEDYYRGVQ